MSEHLPSRTILREEVVGKVCTGLSHSAGSDSTPDEIGVELAEESGTTTGIRTAIVDVWRAVGAYDRWVGDLHLRHDLSRRDPALDELLSAWNSS